MLLITVVTLLCYMSNRSLGTDCNNEAKFHSNLSIESWCMTGIDECSLGSLNSTFPALFDAKGWAPGKPDILNVTEFCQNDSKGDNYAGVQVSWRPPIHSGARDIKGFEIRLEGYMPGYRCAVIQLKEHLTQSVIHSVITGSFFPLKRRQNYIIMLFSLPRSDNSGIVTQSYYSPMCENSNDHWNWRPRASDFTISYDDERKELNVSFARPPDHFLFDKFKLTILRVKPHFLATALINQTFHAFPSVEAGDYQLLLEPYNPNPHDDKLCKCRDDRNQCVTCLTVIKYFTTSVRTPSGANPPVSDVPKWTTKMVIKNINKNKSKKDRRTSKLMTRVFLPICVLITCLLSIIVAVIFVLRRRRKSKKCCKAGSSFRTSSNLGSADDIHACKRYLVLVNVSGSENHWKDGSYQCEFFHILKGMFGQSLTLFRIKGFINSGKQLRECLNKLFKAQNISPKDMEKEHDCSETSLIENKTTGSVGIKLDCCFKQDKGETAMLVCFFVDEHTSTKVISTCRDVCQAMQTDTMLSETVCIYFSNNNMPGNVVNMNKFSYKEELPVLLNYIKQTLLHMRKTNMSEGNKLTVDIVSIKNGAKAIPSETIVTPHKSSDIEGQLTDCENGAQHSQGQFLNMTKRQRYTSNDSGWGASEHSFRSTPIEEVTGSSSKFSLHSVSGTEQDSLSPKSDIYASFDHSPLRCPSDVYFFPPESLTTSSVHTLGEKSGVDNTKIMRIKRGPGSMHNELLKEYEKRQSPSVDSLMSMLKAFNDECTHFMEIEAKPGDVYSVFEGAA